MEEAGLKSIKPANLALLSGKCFFGDHVVLHGFQDALLDGKRGIVEEVSAGDGCTVRMENAEQKHVDPSNIAPLLGPPS